MVRTVTSTLFLTLFILTQARADKQPNIVYIMADELAYFELGHMGNPYLKTPRMDQMAREGLRFTNALAASPVCAPLRGCLMTGKHSGHASVRANDGGTPLRADEVTIASVLKQKNYATGGFGKWGAGGRDSTGVPEKHGFDLFFGYYDQVHAHTFYPPYLIKNSEEVPLAGNVGGRSGQSYSHYAIMEEGLKFIRGHKDEPFFAYFPLTPPHGMYDIPADDPAWTAYQNEKWMKDPKISQEAKNYAAMVTMLDNNLGTIVDLLKELNLDKDTIVFFTGDNGGQDRFTSKNHPRGFFGPNVNPKTGVEFRGEKGQLYEGGLRIPFLVQWPGKIEAGRTSDFVFAQYDILATLAELAGTNAPAGSDGVSIVPELLGRSDQKASHEMFYWEYQNQTAVRYGDWKAIQPKRESSWELYDLAIDISEKQSVSADNPEILKKMQDFVVGAHSPVKPGTYLDPTREKQEKDRAAKWGVTRTDDLSKRSSNKIEAPNLLPNEEMSLVRFSSENRQSDRLAEYLIDGKIHTLWQSSLAEGTVPPHEVVIDLGAERTLTAIHYLSRQDGEWGGALGETEFYLSNSPDQFPNEPTVKTTFEAVSRAQSVQLPRDIEKARYLKIKNLTSTEFDGIAAAAEIGVSLDASHDIKNDFVNLLDLKAWESTTNWATASEIVGSQVAKEWTSVTAGAGIFHNHGKESSGNITSKVAHGDCRLVVEYMIPKGSNSGIYFQNRYEVQILDSYGKPDDKLIHGDNGGIYHRWNEKAEKGQEGYEGTAPRSNQSKAPGEWQTFDITFVAPRFDGQGKKIKNARFSSVILNGVEIHKNVELTGPTRGGQPGAEVSSAPFQIQGDHGPVAFRKLEFYPDINTQLIEKSEALQKIVYAEVDQTTLTTGKKKQLRSMTMEAYRVSGILPLWPPSLEPESAFDSLRALLTRHGFADTNLSYSETPLVTYTDCPVPQKDLIITLALTEVCLRMKQGPETVSEWPNWIFSDHPIAGTTNNDHYNEMTVRFGKFANDFPDPLQVAESFIPQNWVYQRIHQEIQRVESEPPPPVIKVEGLVKVGNPFPQAHDLATLLRTQGHLDEEALKDIDNIYTEKLSEAVRSFQKENDLQSDGILGPATARHISLDLKEKIELLNINLHRSRRLPDDMGKRYLLANLPSAEVYGIDQGVETIRMRVVFGRHSGGTHTPIFRDQMETVVFRPYWSVPYSIATQESTYSDLAYLGSNGFKILSTSTGRELPLSNDSLMSVRDNGAYIRQNGGGSNALGAVKFLFPNKHSVYFHDTPSKHLFKNSMRAHSHGCVRLQNPEGMASWLLSTNPQWDAAKISQAMAATEQQEVPITEEIPVYIVYFTAFPDPKKTQGVGYHRDYYQYDLPGAAVDAPAPPKPQITISPLSGDRNLSFFGKIFRNREHAENSENTATKPTPAPAGTENRPNRPPGSRPFLDRLRGISN